MGFLPGKEQPPSLRNLWLPVALHLGVGPHEISPFHVGMSTNVTIQILLGSFHGCNFSVIAKRHTLTTGFSLLTYNLFIPSSMMSPEP